MRGGFPAFDRGNAEPLTNGFEDGRSLKGFPREAGVCRNVGEFTRDVVRSSSERMEETRFRCAGEDFLWG